MIKICSVWEDESLFEIRITATNGRFAGETCCYTLREEIRKLAQEIKGFPKSVTDQVYFSTYSTDHFSYFAIKFTCVDSSGHTSVRIKIAEIVTYSNASQVNNIAEFDIAVEPAAIDDFSNSLSELSKTPLGKVKAVLTGF